jgi:hypothetical protein
MILFGCVGVVSVAPDAVLSLTIRTRIGTHLSVVLVPSHGNVRLHRGATGLAQGK